MTDLRFAIRQLFKRPGFTAVAVLTLALGIGANTAIFSVIDGVLLRPAPFRDADRLMMVWETDRNSSTTREPASVPDYLDFRERSRRFTEFAAFTGAEVSLVPDDGDPTRLAVLGVSHEFLSMVGMAPLAGRAFTAEDDQPGASPVALLSEEVWETRYARDPAIVGRTVRLDGTATTIVGVLPANADFGARQILGAAAYQRSFADRGGGADVDLWVPLQADPATFPRATHPIFVLGRLAPDATPAVAWQEMSAIMADLEATYSENDGRGAFVEPLDAVVFGPTRPALRVLFVAVGLVLLVACANVANLLLARGTTRFREVAVRTALGADARRLARQFLIEGVLLALLGGAGGVLLAVFGTELLLAIAPADIPRLATVGIDGRVLAATALLSVTVGIVFGMVPVLQARRTDVQSALRVEAGGGARRGTGPGRLRAGLVAAELALAVVLVVGAGLLVRSFWQLWQVDAGFTADGVLKAEYQLPSSRYPVNFDVWPDFREMHQFHDALLARARELPGVEVAAIAANHPLDAGFTNSFNVPGREEEARSWPEISIRRVSPDYLGAVGLSLRRGRALENADGTFAPPVVLINETSARRFFADSDPLGEQVAFWGAARTIVGVVADEKIHGLAKATPPSVYLPLAQAPSVNGAEALLLRMRGDPTRAAAPVRSIIRELDRELAVFGVEPLTRTVQRSVGQQRFTMVLLALFAGVALVLAVVGVHGVLSYMVARRVRELGIRMALGAKRSEVVGLVLRQGMMLAAVGLGSGLVVALVAGRVLRSLLFGVTATDPLTFAAVTVAVFGVALLASWLPARRATRIDPMEALRYE
jgi:predicted permease